MEFFLEDVRIRCMGQTSLLLSAALPLTICMLGLLLVNIDCWWSQKDAVKTTQ